MVRSDWVSVGIQKGLIEKLDKFLETVEAKNIGVTNRQQTISLLLRKFLESDSKPIIEQRENNHKIKDIEEITKNIQEEIFRIKERISGLDNRVNQFEELDKPHIEIIGEETFKDGKKLGEFIKLSYNDEEMRFLEKKYKTTDPQELMRRIREDIDRPKSKLSKVKN